MDLLYIKNNGKKCKIANVNNCVLSQIKDDKLFIVKSGTNIDDLDTDYIAVSNIESLQIVCNFVDDTTIININALLQIFSSIRILSECPQDFE